MADGRSIKELVSCQTERTNAIKRSAKFDNNIKRYTRTAREEYVHAQSVYACIVELGRCVSKRTEEKGGRAETALYRASLV